MSVVDFEMPPAAGNLSHRETNSERRFSAVPFSEIQPRLGSHALIKGLLDSNGLSVIFGETNTGKTFLTLDLALAVALGREWRERRVRQAGVVYVAVEGGDAIRNRIVAYRQHHGLDDATVHFSVVIYPTDLLRENGDTGELIELIEAEAARMEQGVGLVVIDTVSRALAGGNENAPEDMGAFVKSLERIRQATGAHVLAVHHSGKDSSKGMRGHSLLRAAVDTEIEVSREPGSSLAVARISKQRELPCEGSFPFSLDVVELGKDDDGDAITSCVVVHEEESAAPAKSKDRKLSGAASIALGLLRRAMQEGGEVPPASNHIPAGTRAVRTELWRRYCYEGRVSHSDSPAAKRQAFNRASESLQRGGAIGGWGEWVWIA